MQRGRHPRYFNRGGAFLCRACCSSLGNSHPRRREFMTAPCSPILLRSPDIRGETAGGGASPLDSSNSRGSSSISGSLDADTAVMTIRENLCIVRFIPAKTFRCECIGEQSADERSLEGTPVGSYPTIVIDLAVFMPSAQTEDLRAGAMRASRTRLWSDRMRCLLSTSRN